MAAVAGRAGAGPLVSGLAEVGGSARARRSSLGGPAGSGNGSHAAFSGRAGFGSARSARVWSDWGPSFARSRAAKEREREEALPKHPSMVRPAVALCTWVRFDPVSG